MFKLSPPNPPLGRNDVDGEDEIDLLNNDLESLQFGDVVYFYFSQMGETTAAPAFSGFMQADACIERVGFQTQDPKETSPPNFHECLFQVLPMMNYDSSTSKQELSRRKSFAANGSERDMIEHRVKQEVSFVGTRLIGVPHRLLAPQPTPSPSFPPLLPSPSSFLSTFKTKSLSRSIKLDRRKTPSFTAT